MEPLELKINATRKVVISPHPSRVVLEVLHATNWRDGHGFGVESQIILDHGQMTALRDYLFLLTDAPPKEAA
jgi:hypothetical protein